MIRCFLPLAAGLLIALGGCGDGGPADNGAVNAESAVANTAAARPPPVPNSARVRLTTALGDIVVELDGRHAPLTTANFLAYVDQRRFDGTVFYRASRTPGTQGRGFVQGGIRHALRRSLPPIAHEPTSRTGLRHGDGTISMARREGGAGAMGDFFIVVGGAMPSMDAHGGDEGFAAFGRVVEGMDVVRRILAAPTSDRAGSGAMRGQMLEAPVAIVTARREP
ncbi:MAG TPA: peptidylprolyl isomerase [Allosphingosinicella sp.]|jgi:peptidyl-prolyl cis-trans isomerase A (cyclophilin A)|nr:peptidylprolyl isomerase [Allosphingosinicella sp.]